MEQRKLIKLGNSSYALALPKVWVEKSRLKKGDSVFIAPNSNGELILMPLLKSINEERKISIDLEKKDIKTLKKEIAAAYVRGYNILQFTGKKDKEKADNIKSIINGLLSIEIIENKEESIVAKDFFNLEEANQENFIRRVDNNVREMFDITINGIKKGLIENKKIQEIEEIDKDINRFYLLSSRILFSGMDNPSVLSTLKTDSLTLFGNWWLCFNLEGIGDNLRSIVYAVKNSKINEKQIKTILDLFVKINSIYSDSLECFYKKDKELALKISHEGRKILEECEKISKAGDITLVKIANQLEEIENSCYQNAKMVLYMKI